MSYSYVNLIGSIVRKTSTLDETTNSGIQVANLCPSLTVGRNLNINIRLHGCILITITQENYYIERSLILGCCLYGSGGFIARSSTLEVQEHVCGAVCSVDIHHVIDCLWVTTCCAYLLNNTIILPYNALSKSCGLPFSRSILYYQLLRNLSCGLA